MVSTRLLAGPLSVALLVVGLLAFLPDSASACTSSSSGSPKERAERALKDSTAVFSGKVIAIENQLSVHYEVTFRASKVWKGPERETFVVTSDAPCEYTFEKGQEYLVYAGQGFGKQSMQVSLASETKPISKPDDLKAIRLADTSGIVPGYGALGLAGITATVAFLLMRRLLKIR